MRRARLCLAGGDASSFAAKLGMEALEMIAPLTPGAPLCRTHAPGSPADGLEVVFKGGQVGGAKIISKSSDAGPAGVAELWIVPPIAVIEAVTK